MHLQQNAGSKTLAARGAPAGMADKALAWPRVCFRGNHHGFLIPINWSTNYWCRSLYRLSKFILERKETKIVPLNTDYRR